MVNTADICHTQLLAGHNGSSREQLTSVSVIKISNGKCTYHVKLGCVRAPLLQWKALSIIYSECSFVALGIQHAMRVRHITSSVLWLFSTFSTLPQKRDDFWKKSYRT